MKKEIILLIIGYAIVLLFVYTALSKLFSYSIYLYDLRRSPELGAFAVPISIILPGAELMAAAFILMPKRQKMGFKLATILMSVFTIYVFYVLFFADHRPCTCGGIIRELTWKQHFIFNVVFTILAIIGLKISSKTKVQEKTTTVFR